MAATPEVAPKPPKTDGEKPTKAKKEKPTTEDTVKPPKENQEKPAKVKPPKAPKVPKVKQPKPPRVPREKKPVDKKKMLMIAIAVMLLLLIGVGIFIAKMLTDKNDSKAENSSSDVVSSESVDGASEAASDAGASSNADSAADETTSSTPLEDASSSEEGRDALEGADPVVDEAQSGDANTSSAEMVGGAGGVTPEVREEKPFVFDERSLSLPAYSYQSGNAMERAVHADLQAMMESKDDRPGVCIAAVVIADSYVLEDGTLRVLAYVWSNRYAIAENTLFDYGSMAGPCAIDYAGAGVYALEQIHLPRAGDEFAQSVKEMCGSKEETAKRMTNKGFDLELRGQMIRNVSSYVMGNNVDVDYFRAGAQTYHKNGEIYIPKDKTAQSQRSTSTESLVEEASLAPEETEDAQKPDGKTPEEDYKDFQKLPL